MAEIYQLPESNNGLGNIPFSIPVGGMGNGLGFGNGMNGIYDLLGVAIIASLFGWNNGGFVVRGFWRVRQECKKISYNTIRAKYGYGSI